MARKKYNDPELDAFYKAHVERTEMKPRAVYELNLAKGDKKFRRVR